MRNLRIFAATMLMAVGVVSTVGSGGGSGGSPSSTSSFGNLAPAGLQPDVDINSDNAEEVAVTAVQAIGQLFDLTAVIGGQVFPSQAVAPDLLPGISKFELIESVAETGEELADPCAISGTVTVSGLVWNDPQPMFLSVGDTFHLTFDTCDDGEGYTLDGSFTLNVADLDGDPGANVFRLRYGLDDDMTLTVTSGTDEFVASVRVQQTGLEWNSFDFPVVLLTAFPRTLEISSQADMFFWVFDGEQTQATSADISNPLKVGDANIPLMESAVLGGYISYEITVPLQAPDGQDPELGEILISGGDGNGTIRIVIESSASVRLEIDSDDDGTVDDYQYTTWTALQG